MRILALGLLAFGHVAAWAVPPGAVAAPLASRPLSIRELTIAADTVVLGRVATAPSDRASPGTTLVTRIQLDVEQVLKGPAANVVTVVQPGGDAGGVVATVAGAPNFAPGERVLVFLSRRPDGDLRVAHLYQGKFSIEPDAATGGLRAVRREPDTRAVLDTVPLSDALALVRAALPPASGDGRRP
jgi:hypothetical protein